MNTTGKASQALAKCEHGLRDLAVEALQSGSYDVARQMAELAETLADLRVRSGLVPAEATEMPNPREPSTAEVDTGNLSMPASANTGRKKKTKKGGAGKARAYPKFARRDDRLIKIGWSKRKKAEYEHAAPRAAVVGFADHVRSRTRAGRVFSVDDLMPVPDQESGTELPSYQVYLALRWLQEIEAVQKKGRNGYVADHDALASETLSKQWSALPSSSS